MNDKTGAKEKILETVVALLTNGKDPSKISNRELAAIAGVNSALINYYFQSKNNLMGIAAGICIKNIGGVLQDTNEELPPADRIKKLLKAFAEFCLDNTIIIEIAINYNAELKQGSTYTSGLLLPLLREHFGVSKTDLEIKLMSLQILQPMQSLFMYRNDYKHYITCDLSRHSTWDDIIETITDNLLSK